MDPTIKEALEGKDANAWKEAICKEMEGLEAMGTWEVVDKPEHGHIVNSKLVFKVKTDKNGILIKRKARLVAQGFTQQEGVDYDEIFSPVAPIAAVQAVLAIAQMHGWPVHAVDVVQAYLNSVLKHQLYMYPPKGSGIPDRKVLRILKGLYGLKQSGRKWNQELDKFLQGLGFMPAESAPCVYMQGTGTSKVIVLVYVDNTLITSPSLDLVKEIKRKMSQRWKIQDSGNVKNFLGIKISQNSEHKVMEMDQHAYIEQMLSKHLPDGGLSNMPMVDVPKLGQATDLEIKNKY